MLSVAKLVCTCFYLRNISPNLPPPDYLWMQIKGGGIKRHLCRSSGIRSLSRGIIVKLSSQRRHWKNFK